MHAFRSDGFLSGSVGQSNFYRGERLCSAVVMVHGVNDDGSWYSGFSDFLRFLGKDKRPAPRKQACDQVFGMFWGKQPLAVAHSAISPPTVIAADRLKTVLATLRLALPNGEIAVIAHSQGTAVVANALMALENHQLPDTVLLMGSMLSWRESDQALVAAVERVPFVVNCASGRDLPLLLQGPLSKLSDEERANIAKVPAARLRSLLGHDNYNLGVWGLNPAWVAGMRVKWQNESAPWRTAVAPPILARSGLHDILNDNPQDDDDRDSSPPAGTPSLAAASSQDHSAWTRPASLSSTIRAAYRATLDLVEHGDGHAKQDRSALEAFRAACATACVRNV